MLTAIAALSLVIWIVLLVARGGFWQAHERDDRYSLGAGTPKAWPAVVAVIPARNEAASIAQTVSSLLRQDYPGSVRVVVVDDHSEDGTAAVARDAARAMGAAERLTVLRGEPLPAGWTGKLWAVRQGIEAARATDPLPAWWLLTDADIEHAPDNVRQLVTRAIVDRRVMVSLMAKLRCDAWFERALIPAFVLFFQMLYPFSWVNRRDHPMAAAAGGCMLVQVEALRAAGGIEAIRDEIIDDCALGARMKTQGAIWLGLTHRARSVRPYDNLGEIRRMVARTAYAQLHYSPWWLCGTIVSLLVTFVAPPLLALFGSGLARVAGALAWAAMAFAYLPMLRFYGRSRWWGPCLPVVAALYTGFTLDSALQHWRGHGGMWKGRAQARR